MRITVSIITPFLRRIHIITANLLLQVSSRTQKQVCCDDSVFLKASALMISYLPLSDFSHSTLNIFGLKLSHRLLRNCDCLYFEQIITSGNRLSDSSVADGVTVEKN